MRNKRVFIGWNGEENKKIAQRISNLLSEENYSPIVGGEWRSSFTVNEEIIHQMNGCELAIILIEKEIRKGKDGQILSMGLNPNVMMELGYLLHKISDPERVRRVLIDMDPSELPSDLQGTWTLMVEKGEYTTEDEHEEVINKVSKRIVKDFLDYMEIAQSSTDKLDYFDNWEENSQEIYQYTGDVRIADKLIYGMQAAMYSGDFDRLHKCLINIKSKLAKTDRFNDYPAVACALALLNVFVVSRRLTQTLNDAQFFELCSDLKCEYEEDIKDPELKAWCEIFRMDKLELCYELYACGLNDPVKKKSCFLKALSFCDKVKGLIEEQLSKQNGAKSDMNYSLIYQAFTNRNISQLHKQLRELEPEKSEEHFELQKEYCKKTLDNRYKLYQYYKRSSRENFLTMDFVSQEYLLALSEQYVFEEDFIEKEEIANTAQAIFNQWKDRNEVRNAIFNKVKQESGDFLQ